MTSIDFARRRARSGRKVLPGNPKQWEYEHNGLDLREELGIALDTPLNVGASFGLLRSVEILPHSAVAAAAETIAFFREGGSREWSGLAIQLPDGGEVVLYNDSHTDARIRATLMEEFFHIRLGHPRSRVRVLDGERESQRTFNSAVEQAAYASGAAALVPFAALRNMLDAGRTVSAIAESFEVSVPLVSYRIKVTRLSSKLRLP